MPSHFQDRYLETSVKIGEACVQRFSIAHLSLEIAENVAVVVVGYFKLEFYLREQKSYVL